MGGNLWVFLHISCTHGAWDRKLRSSVVSWGGGSVVCNSSPQAQWIPVWPVGVVYSQFIKTCNREKTQSSTGSHKSLTEVTCTSSVVEVQSFV